MAAAPRTAGRARRTSRRARQVAACLALAMAASACGGDKDGTEVLGVVIDRSSASETESGSPTPSRRPTVSQTPTATPESASPTPSPTSVPPPPPPPPDPEPSQPTHPAEVAEPNMVDGASQTWTIGEDGVAYQSLATITPVTEQNNGDGTVTREPDYNPVLDVTPVDGQQVEAVCTAVGVAEEHRDLLVRGTLTIELVVDDVVVATTSGAVDQIVPATATASLLAMDPFGPVLVGEQPQDDVSIACRVTLG